MSYARKAIRGSFIILLMSGIAALIAYATRMILARNLSPSEYGLFYAVFTFMTFLLLFFRDWGLDTALVKFIAEFKAKNENDKIKTAIVSVLSIKLVSSVVLGVFFFLMSDFFAEHYFRNPLASSFMKILCIYVVANALYDGLRSTFQGFQKMMLYSTIQSITNTVTLVLIVVFIYFGLNVFVPVLAYTFSFVFMMFFLFPLSLRNFNFFKYKFSEFNLVSKRLLFFGIPVLLTTIGSTFIGYTDTIMLTYFRSLEEVGVYNVVLPSALIFLFFGVSLSSVLLPLISELWAKKDLVRITEGLRLLYKYSFVAVTPFLLTIFVFAGIFINLFFGKAYVSGIVAFQILLIGVLFYSLAQINNTALSAIGKPKVVTKIVLFAALLNVVLNMFLIPKYGIGGAAFSTSLSYLVVLVFSTLQITKNFALKVPYFQWFKTLFSAFVFIAVIGVIKTVLVINPWLELFISFSVALLIYVFLVYVTKVIDFEELKKYLALVYKKP